MSFTHVLLAKKTTYYAGIFIYKQEAKLNEVIREWCVTEACEMEDTAYVEWNNLLTTYVPPESAEEFETSVLGDAFLKIFDDSIEINDSFGKKLCQTSCVVFKIPEKKVKSFEEKAKALCTLRDGKWHPQSNVETTEINRNACPE